MKSKTEKIAFVIAILILLGYATAIFMGVKFLKNHIFIAKDFLTSRQFISIMEEEDFEVEKIKGSELDDSLNVEEAYRADNDDYEIEFYTFSNVDDAKDFYEKYKDKFDSNSANKKVNLSGTNYAVCTVVNGKKYKFVERIEKTVLLIETESSYEKQIDKVLKVLGY
ncbi:MAG: hypothetical protein IKD76_05220 [Clostridia bacterium]|nr:hypothetical protein [Clostridia bacterium]